MSIEQEDGRRSQCCELGSQHLSNYSPSPGDWALWPADGGTEYHEVKFCPFCGHELSRPVFKDLEEALLSLRDKPPITITFDVDGVLCDASELALTLPYADRQPYPWVSRTLLLLKKCGHVIKVQTARYMKRLHGDMDKVNQYGLGELTAWLDKHGIPHHEVRMGKCSSDLYVDDRGCRVGSNGGTTEWLNSLVPAIAETQRKKG